MANMKRHFIAGKMNKSVDERLLPNGEYVDALNVRLGSTEASEIGSVENSKGNTQLTTLEFNGTVLSNNAKCIGVYEDGTRETIYWFIHDRSFTGINPAGATLDLIVSLNVNTDVLTYHVISTSVLNFNPTYLITGIDMVEDQLFFTDDYNAPRVIDITKNYPEPSGGVDQFTDEEILVIKKPPAQSPVLQGFFQGGQEDYLKDRLLCFAYRYKYEGNQYSAISQFTQPAFLPNQYNFSLDTFLNEGMENYYNLVNVTFNSGGSLVKGIDLLFKESNSNVIKVIRKFDKVTDGIADNTDVTETFDNNKIFTILPDSELLRLFDNVPRFAQAQTIMGNRLMYGNYVDGYDLRDRNNNPLRLEYTTSLISKEVNVIDLPNAYDSMTVGVNYTIDGGVSHIVYDAIFAIDLTGISLVQGARITMQFSLVHDSFTNTANPLALPFSPSPTEIITFNYILPQDFNSVADLRTSTDFIEKIGTALPGGTILPVYDTVNPTSCSGVTMTDIQNCSIVNVLDSGLPITWTKYASGITADGQPISISGGLIPTNPNIIDFSLVAMRRVDDIANPTDPATENVYEYFSATSFNSSFQETTNALSLHSDRNYEVGIVYMDEFNRATTALVSPTNTQHIPCSQSAYRNLIRVEIPPAQIAPSWASRYKFCIKPDVENYQTIYSSFNVLDPTTQDMYFLLEGENAQKIENGSELRIKKDVNGIMGSCVSSIVLEKNAYGANFLDPPAQGAGGGDIYLPAGVYMKLSVKGYSATPASGGVVNPGTQTEIAPGSILGGNWYPYLTYEGLSGEPSGGIYTPPTIPAGSVINFTFTFNRLGNDNAGCGRYSYNLTRSFSSPAFYDDIIDWFEGENIADILDTGQKDPGSISNTYYGVNPALPWPDGTTGNAYWWLRSGSGEITFNVISGASNCAVIFNTEKGDSVVSVSWEIRRNDGVVVFETEPSDALPDVWYESSESYAIDQATGFHNGNVQPQTAVNPAIIDTAFGNCYSFGNGVESYRIRDSIKGKAFDLGERFFSTSAEDYKEADRFAGITYSGVFNTETNVNKLNEFNLGLLNFKNLEESFGAIQILSGRDTDILTLQEDKISYVQSGRNLLSDAAGGSAVTSVPEVLGQQIARIEEYGISQNPESFVQYGFDKFFTDAKRGAVIQLRGTPKAENLTVISELGMRSWFRDLFIGKIDTQKLGAFDPYMNEYVLSSNDTKLPAEEVVLNCGVQRRLTVTSASPESFTVNLGNTVGTCEIAYNIVSFDDPAGSITISEDYTGSSTNVNTIGAGTFNFTKNSVSDEDVVITLSPAGSGGPGSKQVVVLDITVGCPQAQQITLIEVCVSKDSQVGDTIHNQYQWTDGSTFVSPLHSKRVRLALGDGDALTEEVSDYTVITAPQGGGIIPNNGDTLSIISNRRSSDSFVFEGTNRLMFLRSNLLYNNTPADITLLLADATSLPLTGTSPLVTGTVTLPVVGTGEYMYIIYDYFT